MQLLLGQKIEELCDRAEGLRAADTSVRNGRGLPGGERASQPAHVLRMS